MVLARMMETEIWHHPVSARRERGVFNKKTMASTSPSIWEKVAPLVALKPNDSVLPWVSLVPLELLPQCWSLE